jgi:hypothetical protein
VRGIINGKEVVLVASLEEEVLLDLIICISRGPRCKEVIVAVLLGDLLLLLLCFLRLVSLRGTIIN